MQNKSIFSSKNNAFDGQFKSLNNNEMTTLRGGELPPVPPGGGDDYPIDLLTVFKSTTSQQSVQSLPVLKDKKQITKMP